MLPSKIAPITVTSEGATTFGFVTDIYIWELFINIWMFDIRKIDWEL